MPGGLLAALKQRQREGKKKIRRCWNVTQMLLLLHGKAVVSCRERHYTYLGQKGSTHANHRLTELALHSHCSSVRSGAQGKELEICCFLQTVKNLLGRKKNREGRRKDLFLSLLLSKSEMDINEKSQNFKSLLTGR